MVHLIKFPIWNRRILLATHNVDLLAETRKYKMGRNLIAQVKNDPPNPKDYAAVYICEKTGRYVLWFRNNKPRTDTIIHETNHIIKYLMKYIGANQEKEAHAYSQEWLFNEIKRLLK